MDNDANDNKRHTLVFEVDGRQVQVELPFHPSQLTEQHVRTIEKALVELVLNTN